MTRPSWDFDYRSIPYASAEDQESDLDVVIATRSDVDAAHVAAALGGLLPTLEVTPVLDSAPLHWTRVQSSRPARPADLTRALERAGIGVRYLTSARWSSDALAPPLESSQFAPRRARDWNPHEERTHVEAYDEGRWFLGELGVNVQRPYCGTGAGSRLAVIDNDAGATDRLDLDAICQIGVEVVPDGSRHAALLSGWAVGANGESAFVGVAPDASLRHYYIPKPGRDVLSLALAVVRAVDDGADVVLCATHVTGLWSPLLDDALEFAVRAGREGRGTAVVMPTGRECSSSAGAVHASLTLGFGEPASDPRILCIGPSAADGGWFLYRDRRGLYRPFANRGPSVRWLAPGDDLRDPFRRSHFAHAESSGASAVAAGVLLLILGRNPEVELSELIDVITRSATPIAGESAIRKGTTLARELEPNGVDPDGHNAKHGYGRMDATRACLLACDPFSSALVQMGEDAAARRWLEIGSRDGWYSNAFARWAARVSLKRPDIAHAFRSLCRHARLLASEPARQADHSIGAAARQSALLLRSLYASAPSNINAEVEALARASLVSTRLPELRVAWADYVTQLSLELWSSARCQSPPSARAAS